MLTGVPRWLSILLVAGLLSAPGCASTARTPSAADAPGQVLPAPSVDAMPATTPAPNDPLPKVKKGRPATDVPVEASPSGGSNGSQTQPSPSPKPKEPREKKEPSPAPPAPTSGVMKIGIILDGEYFGTANPIDGYDPDEVVQVIRAVIDWVNDTGGIAGRRIEPVIELAPSWGNRAQNEQTHDEICIEMTEDQDVFMVISGVYSTVFAAGCYASHETPLLHTATLYRDEDYERYAPWLLPDPSPTLESVARLLPRALAEQGFFSDPSHKLAVVSWDFELMMDTANNTLVPELERLGANVEEVRFIHEPNDAVWIAGVHQTVREFQERGIDRVVFWDHGGGPQVFLPAAEDQGYRPRYGFSSLTGGDARTNHLPKPQLWGAVGAGWVPGVDVPDETFPLTARELACLAIVNERIGTDYAARNPIDSKSLRSIVAMNSCEYAMLLRDALAPATGKPLAAADVRSHFLALGDRHRSVTPPSPVFGPGLYGGGDSYALIRFVGRKFACRHRNRGCFRYVTGENGKLWHPIPR